VTVRILDDALVNQIAAGEVVERPASVVKELVENALDAEARSVVVMLRDGGRASIRVQDDGTGMDAHDAMTCIERHATSKIRTLHDLEQVDTLGFRGEALPSIASVSRFTLVTRRLDDEVGTRVVIEGGSLRDVSPAGATAGTDIEVRTLFFNVPARRKFLRSTQTELGHCVEGLSRQALARPDVHFELHHDGEVVLRLPRVADRGRRARDLLGEHGQRLVAARHDEDGVVVDGLISPVGVHRGTAASSAWLYVNGRYVRDRVVRDGVQEAYRGLVPKGRWPVVVVDLRIPADRVDVNVHPTKIEVRFREPRRVQELVTRTIQGALEQHGIKLPVERAGPPEQRPVEPVRPRVVGPSARPEGLFAPPPAPARQERLALEPPAPPPIVAEEAVPGWSAPEAPEPLRRGDDLLPVPRYRDLEVLTQIADSYILCRGGGELVVVDQHAAHERVMLHRLRRHRREHLGGAQVLLTPTVLELPRGQVERLVAAFDTLEAETGLRLARVSPDRVAVVAIPGLLGGLDVSDLVRDVAGELAGDHVHATAIDDHIEHVLATMACHSAVRANEPLTPYAMRALLAQLDEVDFSVCAHGRPVAVRITVQELEYRFHRT
jgi:DNA mismatch repair protein MutL